MTEESLEKLYRIIRVAIFAIPILVVAVGLYLVLFPIDTYSFYPDNPKLSKFDILKNTDANQLSFGVFPLRDYRYINLSMDLKKNEKANCQNARPEITLTKTYQAFLYPAADSIATEDELRSFLFDGNQTKYPNGSLLHLKPTNEVFLISHGKKILFPGPEILQGFGYSFDDLTDVQQSDIDEFPDSDQKVYLWTMAHPDGTIFQSFPSHSLYLIFNGKKYPIASKDILTSVWPENYAIPVSDLEADNNLPCDSKNGTGGISCRFDASKLSGIGGYYLFSVNFPANCQVEDVHPGNTRISFSSQRTFSTVKDSLRTIAASALNRYFYKQ
ncbi:MAG TPA: hypothetical protein VK254_03175 [Candidatus Bathyarchaeia archaeon]|nr:hypothetical protein [Candidatus Bathyarchaeia archaeon]